MIERLTRENWLDHGLRVLASSGAAALKAEPLAKSLGVSRGSFYWHFKDLAAFHNALLDEWRRRATEAVMAAAEAEPDRRARLRHLMKAAFGADGRLERAVRSWSAEAPAVAATLAAVDARRVELLAGLIGGAEARPRAAFLYAAYVGRVMLGEDRGGADAATMTEIALGVAGAP